MGFFAITGNITRLVLVGRIVTMDEKETIHTRGALCLADDRIAAVVEDIANVPSEFQGIPPIDTRGTIYPGLIELHNHLSYNFLPLWKVPSRYTNRNQWRTQEPDYQISISLPARIIGSNTDIDYPRSIARFVECRSLLGGTTTTQGLSTSGSGGTKWYKGLTRNVEAPNDPAFPVAGGQTLDYAPGEIKTKLVPALQQNRPFFYHLSEGTDTDARQRFLDLEYERGTWAIDSDLIPIHCTALRKADYSRLQSAAGMVWSPLSNLLLYGQTADVAAAKDAAIPISLGSDWSPSGSKNLLGEMKLARIVSDHLDGLFSNRDLVQMVTVNPARMLGWHHQVGTIERGKKADLLILDGQVDDPYTQLVKARENDVLAVLIDGRPRYGRLGLLDYDARQQERLIVGGIDYSLDLTEADDDPLAGLSLGTAIAKLTFGLGHLPELAKSMPMPGTMDFKRLEHDVMSINFELDDEHQGLMSLASSLQKSAPLKPLPMAPITAVDDPGFRNALKANMNLPDYVRKAL